MATIALAIGGMAVGNAVGGTFLGLSMATIGRAAGAAIGQRIDQRLFGSGSEPVTVGQIDRFRLTGASEGADIAQLWGRMRVAGQVIWASQFLETSTTTSSGEGKGGGSGSASQTTTSYAYSVSLAIALCEGEIARVGRIWADGEEIAVDTLNMRVYPGSADQQPDPKIAATEGAENTPAYRGTAYVVLEDLALAPYGNRIPQLTFEVIRHAPADIDPLISQIRGVTLMTGMGEYALATTQVQRSDGFGIGTPMNTHTPLGPSDLTVALDALEGDLPQVGSVLLPVVWFGDDLRCGQCQIAPMVTQQSAEVFAMPWQVSGITRAEAGVLPAVDERPLYDGTPTDAAVIEAITALQDRGCDVVFAPQIRMTQLAGNALTDPYSGETEQAAQPWAGLITASLAPGLEGSADGTAAVTAEVAAFLGQADAADFSVSDGTISYHGPADSGYRRMVLHYAHLCAAAGGVRGFCIGTGLPGLTQLRDDQGGFPMVAGLIALAGDVRAILGADCKISYAADWTEFHGMTPAGSGDKYFHLDPLWADPQIDFVGIDGAPPLSDWRTTAAHLDAEAGVPAIHDSAYLAGNVTGGELFDWHYPTPEARAAQRRIAISDPDGEDWVWRAKDLSGWWSNPHHDRIGGQRQPQASPWVPQSKPLWLTGLGCAAVHLGGNAPDAVRKGSGGLPDGSDGGRDDLMQQSYLRALLGHYHDPAHNPVSAVYGGQMLDLDRVHLRGWEVRPFPFWPGDQVTWSDGADYAGGYALNGRASNQSLAALVAEICASAGVTNYDVSALSGVVRGFSLPGNDSGRAALQPLMLAYDFDAVERDGVLVFFNRAHATEHQLQSDQLAHHGDADAALQLVRAPAADMIGRVQLAHLDADADYEIAAAEAVLPAQTGDNLTRDELPLALTRAEAKDIVSRWLQQAQDSQQSAQFALSPAVGAGIAVGNIVNLQPAASTTAPGSGAGASAGQLTGRFRIDRVEDAGLQLCEATQVSDPAALPQSTSAGQTGGAATAGIALRPPHIGPTPAELIFLDLPLLTGDESPHAPYLAASARPWPGSIAVYAAPQDSGYALKDTLAVAATLGQSLNDFARGPVGRIDRGAGLEIELVDGALASATDAALLAGANLMAIGSSEADDWEIFQFQTATLLGARQYRLTGLLRGQFGTRTLMPDLRPAGAQVVLLDGVPRQLDLPSVARGVERHFRWGPARRALTDPTFRYAQHSFHGNGLRPYPVAHLRGQPQGGDMVLSWIRSTRIDGDIWGEGDVPLGEDVEAYFLRIRQNGYTLRDMALTSASWTYPAAEIAFDTGGAPYRVEVAQISARYGTGPFMGVDLG